MSYKFSIECTGMTKIISPSLIRARVGGLRAHFNPGIPHFEIYSLITSAKTLFPNKVSFQVPEECIFWVG